ncbi:hypothetical protein CYY_006375 [Polysphondylium violaceum]|uniref:non-specific serine/threonine protein kinase n=1 Tax=Polysphondylium violaceum TaxID=133409 RepID=A0A8J4PR36_9MYCE|nr:hypothetical protein CYY_006375 [Polysphondylium violaceum]
MGTILNPTREQHQRGDGEVLKSIGVPIYDSRLLSINNNISNISTLNRVINCLRYKQYVRIGGGGQGSVFMLNDGSTPLAIKICGQDQLNLLELQKDALVDSPYLSRVSFTFCNEGKQIMVMDYLEGKDLRWYMNNWPSMLKSRVKTGMAQIGYGLYLLNFNRIAHCDIKMDNVIDVNDKWIVIDFGHCHQIGPWNRVGTHCYMLESDVSITRDSYGWGCIFYEIYQGEPPYSNRKTELEFDKIPDPLLGDLLSKLLHIDKDKRITIEEALAHPYFHDIDLESIKKGDIVPPCN